MKQFKSELENAFPAERGENCNADGFTVLPLTSIIKCKGLKVAQFFFDMKYILIELMLYIEQGTL